MNPHVIACYSPAIVCGVWAVIAGLGGHTGAVAFLASLGSAVVAHIRWGRS